MRLPAPSSRRDRTAQALVVGASVLLLTSCEKPTPMVSVQSGKSVDHVQAVCWSFDDAAAPLSTCNRYTSPGALKAHEGVVKVHPGDQVGISVDPDVTAHGWVAVIGQQQLSATKVTDTYYKFGPVGDRDFAHGPLEMKVYAYADKGATRGLWVFRLVRA